MVSERYEKKEGNVIWWFAVKLQLYAGSPRTNVSTYVSKILRIAVQNAIVNCDTTKVHKVILVDTSCRYHVSFKFNQTSPAFYVWGASTYVFTKKKNLRIHCLCTWGPLLQHIYKRWIIKYLERNYERNYLAMKYYGQKHWEFSTKFARILQPLIGALSWLEISNCN